MNQSTSPTQSFFHPQEELPDQMPFRVSSFRPFCRSCPSVHLLSFRKKNLFLSPAESFVQDKPSPLPFFGSIALHFISSTLVRRPLFPLRTRTIFPPPPSFLVSERKKRCPMGTGGESCSTSFPFLRQRMPSPHRILLYFTLFARSPLFFVSWTLAEALFFFSPYPPVHMAAASCFSPPFDKIVTTL